MSAFRQHAYPFATGGYRCDWTAYELLFQYNICLHPIGRRIIAIKISVSTVHCAHIILFLHGHGDGILLLVLKHVKVLEPHLCSYYYLLCTVPWILGQTSVCVCIWDLSSVNCESALKSRQIWSRICVRIQLKGIVQNSRMAQIHISRLVLWTWPENYWEIENISLPMTIGWIGNTMLNENPILMNFWLWLNGIFEREFAKIGTQKQLSIRSS